MDQTPADVYEGLCYISIGRGRNDVVFEERPRMRVRQKKGFVVMAIIQGVVN